MRGSGAGDEFITIARVLKPQGRRGEVAAELQTDFPERFAIRKRLFLLSKNDRRREAELESHWLHKGQVVLKFRGVDSISAAEELVGSEVQLPREERAELEAGAEYVSDLIGAEVLEVSSETRPLGKIEDVFFGAGDAPLLQIRGEREELLVPFAEAYVKCFDRTGKRLEMALPAGMLELGERKELRAGKKAKRKRL